MADAIRWRKDPHPDPEVVTVFREALEAAQKGHARCALVVVVNPMLEIEIATAGITDDVRRNILAGALVKAAWELQKQ